MLSGNCGGMSSMHQMLSDLPETQMCSLTHQPPVCGHTSAACDNYIGDNADIFKCGRSNSHATKSLCSFSANAGSQCEKQPSVKADCAKGGVASLISKSLFHL